MADLLNGAGSGPWPQTRVRLAQHYDLPELMAICHSLSAENAIAAMVPDVVERELTQAINRQHSVVGVIGQPGKLEAAAMLRLGSLWYNPNYFWLEDRYVYVLPEYRASDNASDLMGWSQWWAESLGIPLMMGVVSNERTKAKIRLYERKLGPMSGALFLVGARTGLEGN